MNNKLIRITPFALPVPDNVLAVINRNAIDVTALEAWMKNADPSGPLLGMFYKAVEWNANGFQVKHQGGISSKS